MNDVRQALTGILAALISAVIILGSIVLALSETGQKIARLPGSSPELSTPMPPAATSKPGEPTYTAVPTRVPQTPTAADTFTCTLPPGWQRIEALPGDTWELLAEQSGISLDELLKRNCLEPEDIQNSKPGYGMLIALPVSTPTLVFTPTPTGFATATPTRPTPEPTRAKAAQSKPKATTCAGHPAGWVLYIVRSGDTLSRIGILTGVNWVVLRNANCLPSTRIFTGQRLWVPRPPVVTAVRTATPRPTRTATLTRTPIPTTQPPDTPVPTDTERPTEPPPSDTPVPSDTPAPPPYP